MAAGCSSTCTSSLRPISTCSCAPPSAGGFVRFGGARKRSLVQRIWLQSAHQTEVETAPTGGSGPRPRPENPTHHSALFRKHLTVTEVSQRSAPWRSWQPTGRGLEGAEPSQRERTGRRCHSNQSTHHDHHRKYVTLIKPAAAFVRERAPRV